MPGYAGRDVLLKIAVTGAAGAYMTLGAARVVTVDIANSPVEATGLGAGLSAAYINGGQNMRISLQGLFKDSQAEKSLRDAALSGAAGAYKLCFGNGDIYSAAFMVENYRREGVHDGQEAFALTLLRSGAGEWACA